MTVNEETSQILEFVRSKKGVPQVKLKARVLLKQAVSQTGLSDWGDKSFAKPFRVLLRSLNKQAQLHSLGRFMMQQNLLRLLRNRLKIQNDLTRYPEILKVPIDRPLYVLGIPRTGTTYLHKLLACDPNARSMALWEGVFPSPPPESATRDSDPRIEIATDIIDAHNILSPQLAAAHKLTSTDPDECQWLFEHTFADQIFMMKANVPKYSSFIIKKFAEHPGPHMYYKMLLQLLAWRCPAEHWVLKAPRHLSSLGLLMKTFPDARIVWTHRNPVKAVASICSLNRITQACYSDHSDAKSIGRRWHRGLKKTLNIAAIVREQFDQKQFLDIRFRDLIADPIDTVKRIYEYHDYPYSNAFEQNMRQWIEDNPRHKYGKHEYALEDYGLDPSDVRNTFGDYCSKMGLDNDD